MTRTPTLMACVTVVALGVTTTAERTAQAGAQASLPPAERTAPALDATLPTRPSAPDAWQHTRARLEGDLEAMQTFRPAYRFWRHIFRLPDGSVAFGSALDGRLLATLPLKGDWAREAVWEDAALARLVAGRPLPSDLSRRREEVARLLEPTVGPVLHNPSRGLSLLPNVRRYGAFLDEWGAIYERFAVPADIGLAQAIVESGLNGTVRSPARAIGFCQWLETNWRRLKRLSPHVIEGYNQTTQAPYCAAYLTILATKYGSFIAALSEHHTGGTNVGRTLISGERLGGASVRERYFLGSEFARDLRRVSPATFKDVYGTYGPRSFLYAEMVFGNMANVTDVRSSSPQSKIFAMRTRRALTLAEITRSTGRSVEEIRRFNPALRERVPPGGTLYLPRYVEAFGPNVSFWHRPPNPAYARVLNEFVRLDVSIEEWDSESFDTVLRTFRSRFEGTGTEEGTVMAATLAYVLEDRRTSRQMQILAQYRASEHVLRLFEQGRVEREALRTTGVASETAR